MKRMALDLLCCPNCRSQLDLREDRGGETLDDGSLACAACELVFPVTDGIPRFIGAEELSGSDRPFTRFYDRFAPVYDFFTKAAMAGFGGDRRARKEVLDRLELRGGRTLEISIGSGANLPYLFESEDVDEVLGLDISAGQLARCSSRMARQEWKIDLFQGTADALPFKNASFDSILHLGGINFFSRKKEAIEEMIRVARPGSRIVIADEAERQARIIARLPGFARSLRGQELDLRVPVHLVPEAMKEVQVHDIWMAHGRPHGYCLEFRKPD